MKKKVKFAVERPRKSVNLTISDEDEQYFKIECRPMPSAEAGREAVQWLGQPAPGPGPRKCWACGYEWILQEGMEDVCPKCGLPNVIRQAAPMRIQYVFKSSDSTPQESLERAERLLQELRQREVYTRRPDEGLTVGDLSIVTERKKQEEAEGKTGLDSLYIIPKDERGLDQLYEGPRASDIKPSQSESQKLIAQKYARDQEALRLKMLMEEKKPE